MPRRDYNDRDSEFRGQLSDKIISPDKGTRLSRGGQSTKPKSKTGRATPRPKVSDRLAPNISSSLQEEEFRGLEGPRGFGQPPLMGGRTPPMQSNQIRMPGNPNEGASFQPSATGQYNVPSSMARGTQQPNSMQSMLQGLPGIGWLFGDSSLGAQATKRGGAGDRSVGGSFGRSLGKSMGPVAPKGTQPPEDSFGGISDYLPPEFSGSLNNYLSQAGNGEELISERLKALQGLRDLGQQRTDTGAAAIGSLYTGLGDQIRSDQGTSQQYYQGAQNASQASTDAALASIAKAQQTAQTSRAAEMAALGISDSGAQAASTGADYNAADVSNLALTGDSARQNLVERGATQNNTLGQNAIAAGFAGNAAQGDLRQRFTDYLTELAGQEAQLRDQAGMQAREMATAQYGADVDAYNRAYQRAQDRYNADTDYDQQMWEREYALGTQAQQGGGGSQFESKGFNDATNYLQGLPITDNARNSIMTVVNSAIGRAGGSKKGADPYSEAYRILQTHYKGREDLQQAANQVLYMMFQPRT